MRKEFKLGSESVEALLRGGDLIIRCSEMLSIIGPSGSGKSTPLDLIGGPPGRIIMGIYEGKR